MGECEDIVVFDAALAADDAAHGVGDEQRLSLGTADMQLAARDPDRGMDGAGKGEGDLRGVAPDDGVTADNGVAAAVGGVVVETVVVGPDVEEAFLLR